jgi:hypothetical protein
MINADYFKEVNDNHGHAAGRCGLEGMGDDPARQDPRMAIRSGAAGGFSAIPQR